MKQVKVVCAPSNMKKIETDHDLPLSHKLGSLHARSSSVGLDWQALAAESHYRVAVEICGTCAFGPRLAKLKER